MIQAVWPILQAPSDEMEFGRMQVPGRWIDAQRVPVPCGRNAFRRANRSGIEQQLREECRAVCGTRRPRFTIQCVERRRFEDGGIRWQVEHRHAFVVTERIGHIGPVQKMRLSSQRFQAMFGRLVIFLPCHDRTDHGLFEAQPFTSLPAARASVTGKSGDRRENTGKVEPAT